MSGRRIAVVGASLSGLRAAQQLRAQGYEDELVIVGAEPHLRSWRPITATAPPRPCWR